MSTNNYLLALIICAQYLPYNTEGEKWLVYFPLFIVSYKDVHTRSVALRRCPTNLWTVFQGGDRVRLRIHRQWANHLTTSRTKHRRSGSTNRGDLERTCYVRFGASEKSIHRETAAQFQEDRKGQIPHLSSLSWA